MHVQRATLAGGIAIGCVADLNLQLYMALIIGSLGGLISTLSYKYLTVCVFLSINWINFKILIL